MRLAALLAALAFVSACSLFEDGGGGKKNPRPLRVEFVNPPHGDTVANREIEDIVVRLDDANGDLVEDLAVEFSLEIQPGSNPADWTGPDYVFSTNGTATFSGIRIRYPGSYNLQAFALIDGVETYDRFLEDPFIVHSLFLEPATIHPAGRVPTATRAADLDGDGDLDLATSNQYSHDVTLLVNDGAGAFTAAAPVPVPTQPTRMVIARLTTGASPDIAVSSMNGLSAISNESAPDAPSFAAPVLLDAIAPAFLEEVMVGSTASALAFSYSTAAQLHAGTAYFAVTIPDDTDRVSSGDFDGDGRMDLLASSVVNTIDRAVWILLAQTGGGYGPATPVADALDFAAAEAGNFDGLGGDDAVVLDFEPPSGIVVLINSSGSLIRGEKLVHPVDASLTRFGVVDADADGLDDVFVANGGSGFTFRSRGDGSLELFQVFRSETNAQVTFGDLDGDGDPEVIITTDDDPGELRIYENVTIP